MKIGVLSLRAARGVVDSDSIRREGDRLIEQLTERLAGYRTLLEQNVSNTLTHFFDPSSGLLSVRVANLVKDDGELASLIQGQVMSAQQQLAQTFEKFIGENSPFLSLLSPNDSNQLLVAMRNTVNSVMQAERAAILTQFSLDEPSSALSRLVRELTTTHGNLTEVLGTKMEKVMTEFSTDKPDSALNRLVGRVEEAQRSITRQFSLDSADSALSRLKSSVHSQLESMAKSQQAFQTEVVGLLASLQARKQAEARSTIHGFGFQASVREQLRLIGGPTGDVIDDCGSTTGFIRHSKVGDFLVTLARDSVAAGARIVVEAKESSSYTLKSTLGEADEARRNRDAQICLFVHSSITAPRDLEALSKYGNDVVVVWNREDPNTDVVLKAGYLTAKALCIRLAQTARAEAASFQKVDKAVEVIRKQIEGFTELHTCAGTVESSAKKIIERTRVMREELERQVQILFAQIAELKVETGNIEL